MPYFYHSLFPSRNDQVFRTVKDPIKDLTVGIDVGLWSVSEHSFEVRERGDGSIALIFVFEAVL